MNTEAPDKMYEVGDETEMQSTVIARKQTEGYKRVDLNVYVVLHVQFPGPRYDHARLQYIVHRYGINDDGKRVAWSGGYYDTFEDAADDYRTRG